MNRRTKQVRTEWGPARWVHTVNWIRRVSLAVGSRAQEWMVIWRYARAQVRREKTEWRADDPGRKVVAGRGVARGTMTGSPSCDPSGASPRGTAHAHTSFRPVLPAVQRRKCLDVIMVSRAGQSLITSTVEVDVTPCVDVTPTTNILYSIDPWPLAVATGQWSVFTGVHWSAILGASTSFFHK